MSSNDHKPKVTGSLNGQPVIRFNDGVAQDDPGTLIDAIDFPIDDISQPWSMVLVYHLWGSVGDNGPDGSGDNIKGQILNSNNEVSYNVRYNTTGSHLSAGSEIAAQTRIGETSFDFLLLEGNGSVSKIGQNGNILSTGDAGTHILDNFVRLGGAPDSFRSGAYLDVVEFMIFTGSIVSSSLEPLSEYFQKRYGLTF